MSPLPPMLHASDAPPAEGVGAKGASSRTRARGQSVVEFALVLPLLLILLASILDLGRVASAQIAITNAAREGAFQASVTPASYSAGQPCPSGGASNLVICRTMLEGRGSSLSIAPTDIALSCNPSDCAPAIGNTVTVEVTTQFHLLTPVLAPLFGGSQDFTLSASSVAQIETLPTPSFTPPWATPSPAPSPSASASASPSPTAIICSLPSAGFTFDVSPNSYRAPATMAVTDTSTDGGCGIASWAWDWGDGTSDFVRNPSAHPYTSAGDYSIVLTVTNAAGSNTTGAVVIRVKG